MAKKPSKKQQPVEKPRLTGQVHTYDCQVCGKPRSAWGFGRKGQNIKWYCFDHHEIGQANMSAME